MPTRTVLVVDDEADCLLLLEARLTALGHRVLTATTAEEALQSCDENRPDVILVDIVLPKLNGFWLLRQIKSSAEHATIPVIMMTGKTSDAAGLVGDVDLATSMQFGAASFLGKPIRDTELLAAIDVALSKRR